MRKIVCLGGTDFLELSRIFLEDGRSMRFKANGWSMRPFIQNGDYITVGPIADSSTRKGDIVFYTTDQVRVVVHRVIKKYKNDGGINVLIKGDACFGPPDMVPVQNILGRVSLIERDGRKRRLDTWSYGLIGLLFASISPFSRLIYPMVSKAKHSVYKTPGFCCFMGIFRNFSITSETDLCRDQQGRFYERYCEFWETRIQGIRR